MKKQPLAGWLPGVALGACLAWAPARATGAEGIDGGVVVVIGCGDPANLVELAENEAVLVRALDTDPALIARARESILERGAYGRVSVGEFDGKHLPYADELVNFIATRGVRFAVAEEEMLRVLVPGGRALIGERKVVKPLDSRLDDWTHFLHGPGNNAVSRDKVVGPIGSLKWKCGPLWSRSHEITSSLNILVSSGGRVFYVVDEAITSITTPDIPEKWALVARDAFNGKLLWKMPLPEWRSRLGQKLSLRSVPPTAQRSLVADGNRLHVSPLLGAPIHELDAATGKVLRTFEDTVGVREFVRVGDSLVLIHAKPEDKGQGSVARLDLKSGKLVWSAARDKYKGESLAASGKYAIYQNGKELVCLAFTNGKELWRSGPVEEGKKLLKVGQATHIVHDDLVLECGSNLIVARKGETGEVLWQAPGGGKAMRGQDGFVARGCLWHAAGDQIVGYDLQTGEPARTVDPSDVQSDGHHLRCYRAKATENFLITQYRGVEFIGIDGQPNAQTDWTRGACSLGVVPANGLLYVPPNPCFCYPGVKVTGLNAYGAIRKPKGIEVAARLTKGPAFGAGKAARSAGAPSKTDDQWPTYRHDPARHGSTVGAVPKRISEKWQADLGGRVSPPVMAGGMVYVAVKDRHSVCALDAESGDVVWRFFTGARVDSPPTIHQGCAYFGSADGHLYCVTADDGELVWKFRAAPEERMIMVMDQLESAWPVHGSVLVKNDVVYCTAGRSTMLDGGVWLYGLNAATGEVLYQSNIDTLTRTRTDTDGKPAVPSYVMDGSHSDILVCEGGRIHMGTMMFDLQLKRLETPHSMDKDESTEAMDISKAGYITPDQELRKSGYENYRSFHRYQERAWPEMTKEYKERFGGVNLGDMEMTLHIAPTAGFLDETWFNRTYWMYSARWPGWYHAHRGAKTGHLLVVGKEQTYALQAYPERNMQSPLFTPGGKGYLIVADSNDNEPVMDHKTRGATKGLGYTRGKPPEWHDWVPIRVRGMVEAGDVLYMAGVPDEVPEGDPMAAFEGRRGAILRGVSAEDGTIVMERRMEAPPVFDGLIAAGGCLFIATEDGRVHCFGPAKKPATPEETAILTRLREEQAGRRREDAEAAKNRSFGNKPATLGETTEIPKRTTKPGALPREGWSVEASSVEGKAKGFAPGRMLDGDPMTSWHSKWSGGRDPFPHELVIDLGRKVNCRGIDYLPRQDRAQNGRIRDYEVYASMDGKNWGAAVAKGSSPDSLKEQRISFRQIEVRYLKLVIRSGYDKDLAAIAELNVLGGE